MSSDAQAPEDWSSLWMASLRDGDEAAMTKLWDLYFKRMVIVANRQLRGADRIARDEEDIAMSAFKSFCLGLRDGKFLPTRTAGCLWPLLVSLTLNKAKDQIRSNNRQKRGGSGDPSEPKRLVVAVDMLPDVAGRESPPDLTVAAKDALEHLLHSLAHSGDQDLTHIAIASFQGDSPAEIAERLECSPRTVQRKLKTIRSLWEQVVECR